MGRAITGLVVGVLIDQHGSHIRFQQGGILVRFQSAHVYVDAVHFAHAVKSRVQDADGLGQIFNIRIGQLAADKKNTLVPLTDKLEGGLAHFRRGHVLALNGLVAFAVGAVQAFAAAMIGDVQGRRKHNAVAVNLLLNFIGGCHDAANAHAVLHTHEGNGFRQG